MAHDEVVQRPGTAIRDAAHGLLVSSPASLAGGWARQEYYALTQRSIETGRLLIPVLIGDVELPAFAAPYAPPGARCCTPSIMSSARWSGRCRSTSCASGHQRCRPIPALPPLPVVWATRRWDALAPSPAQTFADTVARSCTRDA
jgi:hypothetical protein